MYVYMALQHTATHSMYLYMVTNRKCTYVCMNFTHMFCMSFYKYMYICNDVHTNAPLHTHTHIHSHMHTCKHTHTQIE